MKMRKLTLLLFSGLFLGFISYVGMKNSGLQIMNECIKGPPGNRTFALSALVNTDQNLSNNKPYFVLSSFLIISTDSISSMHKQIKEGLQSLSKCYISVLFRIKDPVII